MKSSDKINILEMHSSQSYWEPPIVNQEEIARRAANVIQIRMTERELELKYVPVSFFVKKYQEKG